MTVLLQVEGDKLLPFCRFLCLSKMPYLCLYPVCQPRTFSVHVIPYCFSVISPLLVSFISTRSHLLSLFLHVSPYQSPIISAPPIPGILFLRFLLVAFCFPYLTNCSVPENIHIPTPPPHPHRSNWNFLGGGGSVRFKEMCEALYEFLEGWRRYLIYFLELHNVRLQNILTGLLNLSFFFFF